MMSAILFHTDYAESDPADEREFRREAVAFGKWLVETGRCSLGDVRIEPIPVSRLRETRRAHVESTVLAWGDSQGRTVGVVAFFCHGLRRSLQTGHGLGDARALASVIATASEAHRAAGGELHIPLFACSTGGPVGPNGRGSFAHTLASSLGTFGATSGGVLSHTTAGHTTRNARMRIFGFDGAPVPEVVDFTTERPLFHRLRGMLSGTPDGRWRAAFMPREAVRLEASSTPPYKPKARART